jgi:hypothetical protein
MAESECSLSAGETSDRGRTACWHTGSPLGRRRPYRAEVCCHPDSAQAQRLAHARRCVPPQTQRLPLMVLSQELQDPKPHSLPVENVSRPRTLHITPSRRRGTGRRKQAGFLLLPFFLHLPIRLISLPSGPLLMAEGGKQQGSNSVHRIHCQAIVDDHPTLVALFGPPARTLAT